MIIIGVLLLLITIFIIWILKKMSTFSADYLVVAGGGSGAYLRTGGAGGMLTGTDTLTAGNSYGVTVGIGVAGTSNAAGNQGNNSVFNGHTSLGGGTADIAAKGTTGGSGGGGFLAGGGAGTGGQGNNGGNGSGAAYDTSGGGGGAGSIGTDSIGPVAGNGGNGLSSSITGSPITYAGGGGGACDSGVSAGTGGTGGGGNGGLNTAGTNGTDGLGGGGGGSGVSNQNGGNGGSGVVIIAYTTAGMVDGSGGTISHASGKTIHTFSTSDTFIAPTSAGGFGNYRTLMGMGF